MLSLWKPTTTLQAVFARPSGSPVSGTPIDIRRGAPALGEHTAEILSKPGIRRTKSRPSAAIKEGGGMIDFYYCGGSQQVEGLDHAGGTRDQVSPVGQYFERRTVHAQILTISPNNRMPAIVDHDPPPEYDGKPVTIAESGAILLHLAQDWQVSRRRRSRKRKPWNGCSGRLAIWGRWQVSTDHFWNYADGEHEYAATRYANEYNRCIGVLERRLEGRDWLAGGAYSIADMASWPWVLIAKAMDQPLDNFPNVSRWRSAIRRPAVQKASTWAKICVALRRRQMKSASFSINKQRSRHRRSPKKSI